jgi:hypothetical protein
VVQVAAKSRRKLTLIHFQRLGGQTIPGYNFTSTLQYSFLLITTCILQVIRYHKFATILLGDEFFLDSYVAEMMLEIARFWGHFCKFNRNTKRYEILGVMGPDEFHEKYPDEKNPGYALGVPYN